MGEISRRYSGRQSGKWAMGEVGLLWVFQHRAECFQRYALEGSQLASCRVLWGDLRIC